jgi:hypothetical protein
VNCNMKYTNLTENKGSFLITLSLEGVREQDSGYNIAPRRKRVTGG